MVLEIVSPESKLFTGEITSVTAPGINGSFQILNNHDAIVSILKKGFVKIESNNFNFAKESESKFKKESEKEYVLAINSGTLEMKNNKIIILVD